MAVRDIQWLLPRPIRELPADLAGVTGWVFVTNLAVFLPGINETSLRVIIGLPFVLFIPGYALIAALFPEHGEPPHHSVDGDTENERGDDGYFGRSRGIDGIERVALSFGLSIAVVPLIGLVLNFTPWGIRLVPIIVSVSGFTLVMAGLAAHRRWELPKEERFSVPYHDWIDGARSELFEPESRTDSLLNILLVASILLAVTSGAYAVAVPKQGETFTEFFVLTEDDDGELVAADYPTEFVRGETKPIVVGIGNHEHQPMDYTVVVELQRVEFVNNSTRLLEETELDRFRTGMPDNETRMTPYDITPTITGERLRLVFLLYVDDPPPDPSIETAYRELHLWINVTMPE